MNPLKKAVDSWFGRGEASITIPPMDGAFRPNDLLDLASSNLETPAPDCLAVTSHGVIVSSDRSLLRVDKPGGEAIASFDTAISALTGLPDGGAAVGLIDGRIVFVGGERGGTTLAKNPGVACITALAPASDGALLVANGSATNGPAAWKRDLMEKNASGSVWRIDRQRRRLMLCRRSGLPLRPPRRRWLNRGLGKLALRADADFSRRRPSQRAGAGEPSRLSEPLVAGRRQDCLARAVCAAQPACRIRPQRKPLPRPHDPRNRRRPLGRALSSLRRNAAGADATGRRQTTRCVEAMVAQPILRIGRASRSHISSDR